MIDLYDFQATAADEIADRTVAYLRDPIEVTKGGVTRRVPFIQLLSSITASGKTIILADAVSTIAKELGTPPVVLWLSKATVVVEQTYAALDAGGSLHSLIADFVVRTLADYDSVEVTDIAKPFLFFATVGTFNQKDKEQGTRRVFRSAIDDAAQSTWKALQLRPDNKGTRRPLVVVYDEAHNLSNQQTDLLLELQPDVFLLATATQRIPRRFHDEIVDMLVKLGGKEESDLFAQVDAKAVADSGLIKTTIELVGRQAPMEEVVERMLSELTATEKDASQCKAAVSPKAVYVCKTNVIEGSDERDNHKQPFAQRQAPPILIWRQLTERLGVDPATVAVYSDLRVDKSYPLPDEFKLFSGGDKDYARFTGGNFRHIIFNQSLQEGWDDPQVYFAYIDKSMGSRVQAEQVVGRLLRQPGRKSFPADRLNTAQIHVRVDSAGVFDEVVGVVQEKIKNEQLTLKVVKVGPGAKPREEYRPKATVTVPVVAVMTDDAEGEIQKAIDSMADFRGDDGTNTSAVGKTARIQKVVGSPGNESFVWKEEGHSAFVLARWLFAREVRRIYPNALGLAITSDGDGKQNKFDARIGLGSKAAKHIATVAQDIAKAFVDGVFLKLRKSNPYVVGSLMQTKAEVVPFKNAVHSGYADLNGDERPFAESLDRTGERWCRNPSRSGYSIPLAEIGKTENFFPDFLVWKKKDVFAIDTKGAHLHADAMRKLMTVKPAAGSPIRLYVRFVTPGLVDEKGAKKSNEGFTVWSMKANGERVFRHYETADEAVNRCLKAGD